MSHCIYFDVGSAEVAGLTSFTVASGQPSAFHRNGMIARVAFPSIRTSPSKSDVNQSLPSAFNIPACPGPINGPLVVARNTLPPPCNMSTPALSRYGPVIVRAASDADVVSAVGALAARTPVHEQIIVVIMPAQIGGLDGFIVSQGIYLRIRRDAFAGLRIKLNQFDAAPIGTKRQPQAAIGVVKHGWVNRIVVVTLHASARRLLDQSNDTPDRSGPGWDWWPGRWRRSFFPWTKRHNKADTGRRLS